MTPAFLAFIRIVVDGDVDAASRLLRATPALATMAAALGATHRQPAAFFFPAIAHYLYAGDTALHMAAAAFQPQVAALLLSSGATCQARNRRGAEPLHYAADANRWAPLVQADTIRCLVSAGADPNARDRSGVSPLHRAIRTRSLAAVAALLDGGADARQRTSAGSTPLHLAVQPTGRGGSGGVHAREQQAAIVQLLLEHGARVSDVDRRGRDARQAATGPAVKALLVIPGSDLTPRG